MIRVSWARSALGFKNFRVTQLNQLSVARLSGAFHASMCVRMKGERI